MELLFKNRPVRILGWLECSACLLAMLWVPYSVISTNSKLWTILPGVLVFLLLAMITGVPLLLRYPRIRLTQEGVYVRWFIRTRFAGWCEVCQVGLLLAAERYRCYQIALLLTGGVILKRDDVFYQLRNLGKIVYIPENEETLTFIQKYYGPLDFDFSSRKAE